VEYSRENRSSMIFLLYDKDVENSFMVMGQKIKIKTLDWAEFNEGEMLW